MNTNQLYKKLLSDVFSYGFLDSLTRLISFLLLPVLTRIFSVSEYGIIDLIAAFSSFLLPISTLGLPSSLARYFSGESEEDNKYLYSSLVAFNFIFSLIILSGVYIFSKEISLLIADQEGYSLYIKLGALAAFFNSLASLPQMLLRRKRKIKIFGGIKITTSVLYVGITLLFIYVYDSGIRGVFAAQVLAFFAGFITSVAFTVKYYKWKIDIDKLRRSMRFSLPMFPSIFVTWANEQFNRFLIISILNASVLGLFGAAFKVSSIVRILAEVFRKAWMPLSMEIIGEKDRGEMINGLMKYYLTFFLLLGLVFSMFAPEIIGILLPEKYSSAYLIIPWLAGAFIIHNSGSILNMGSIIREKTVINTIAAWTGFAINVLITIVLLKPLGILGAAVGLFISSLVANYILLWKTEMISEIRFSKHYILSLITIYIMSNIVILGLIKYTDNQMFSLLSRIGVLILVIFIIDRGLWKNSLSNVLKLTIKKVNSLVYKR